MPVDQPLIDAAIAQALARYPTGEAGAAAVYLDDGRVLTSVAFESPNEATNLCHEAGAYCEANRLSRRVVASVCVVRPEGASVFVVLAPCGICQERLATWGRDIEVGVSQPDDPRGWASVKLSRVQPWYWRDAFE